jgi:hypothetical protein
VRPWQRAAVVFGFGFLLATFIGGFANLIDLGRDATYVLAGAAIALVAGLGVPWVLGWDRPMLFKGGDVVHSQKAAVVAYEGKNWVALSYDETFFIAHRLQQHRSSGVGPIIYPARGAVAVRPLPPKRVVKGVQVVNRHRHDPTMFRPRHAATADHEHSFAG